MDDMRKEESVSVLIGKGFKEIGVWSTVLSQSLPRTYRNKLHCQVHALTFLLYVQYLP